MKDRYTELAEKIRKSLWEYGGLKYPLQGGIDVKIIESTIRAHFEEKPDEGMEDNQQEKALQALVDQAQELDMGYGKPYEGMEAKAEPTHFEGALFRLINSYANAGLSKFDTVQKLKYVTKSCEMS